MPTMAGPIGLANFDRATIRTGRLSVPVSTCPPQGRCFAPAGAGTALGHLSTASRATTAPLYDRGRRPTGASADPGQANGEDIQLGSPSPQTPSPALRRLPQLDRSPLGAMNPGKAAKVRAVPFCPGLNTGQPSHAATLYQSKNRPQLWQGCFAAPDSPRINPDIVSPTSHSRLIHHRYRRSSMLM